MMIPEYCLQEMIRSHAGDEKSGVLQDDFLYSKSKLVRLDEKSGVAHFNAGVDIPLRPFFGSMGVAPPESTGRVSSAPPGMHAGNMDNRELVRRHETLRTTFHDWSVSDARGSGAGWNVTMHASPMALV